MLTRAKGADVRRKAHLFERAWLLFRWVVALFAVVMAALMTALGVATVVAALLGAFSEELTRDAVVVWGLAELAMGMALATGSALAFLDTRYAGLHLVFACIATAGAALMYANIDHLGWVGWMLTIAFALPALRSWVILLGYAWAALSYLRGGPWNLG